MTRGPSLQDEPLLNKPAFTPEKIAALVEGAIAYLRGLEEFMMEHDLDMLMGETRPPACVADELASALEHLGKVEVETWQPIETAPKDGRYVIAARFRESELKWVMHSRWISAEEVAENEGGEPDDYDDGWTQGSDDHEPEYPTHWQHLPAPPSPTP